MPDYLEEEIDYEPPTLPFGPQLQNAFFEQGLQVQRDLIVARYT